MGKNSLTNFICHLSWLKKLCLCSYTSPQNHLWISKPYKLLFSELESLIKLYKNLLNNFMCHLSWLEKLSPSHTHPLISIREFLKLLRVIIFWVESLVKCWMWIGKKFPQYFMCQLSWLKKLSPTHTHPLKTIREFSKPCELLFFELESLIKCWMWIGKKFTQ